MKEEAGVAVKGKRALLVGAGGTARSIAAALAMEGVHTLTVCNRDRARGEQLAGDVGRQFPAVRVGTVAFDPAEFQRMVTDADILVNATPTDLHSPKGPLISERTLHPALAVFDATYAPATPLVMEARRVGCTAVAGTRLLLWQVVFSVRQWTGLEPPRAAIERAMGHMLAPSLSPA